MRLGSSESTISFSAVLYSENFNGTRGLKEKEYAIVPHTQPQFLPRRTKLLHVANSSRQIIINSVENSKRGLAVDRGNLGLSSARPENGLTRH